MPATVHFATNRVLTGAPDNTASYSTDIVAPTDPTQITYGTAFVTSADLDRTTSGTVTNILNINKGGFAAPVMDDLTAPGRDLLVFIHGFDNTFDDALTRAAYLQQWFSAARLGRSDCTMVAFAWPSIGQIISLPIPWNDYFHDQTKSGQSSYHIMSFFANLLPIVTSARAKGARVNLISHSMGNWALQGAVESWFLHGQGSANLFDTAVLAAADEIYTTFGYPPPGRLSRLCDLAKRIVIYYSRHDAVLALSDVVNLGAQRLGQDGPQHLLDTTLFPASIYKMMDCTDIADYAFDPASSHQYYRDSPSVRKDIASVL